jgi:hypothetical protein
MALCLRERRLIIATVRAYALALAMMAFSSEWNGIGSRIIGVDGKRQRRV